MMRNNRLLTLLVLLMLVTGACTVAPPVPAPAQPAALPTSSDAPADQSLSGQAEATEAPEVAAATPEVLPTPVVADLSSLRNTYVAIRPAASGGGTALYALRLNDDGTATFATEFHNDEPPIVEVGTWQDNGDGTVTVTLTGRQDREYDQPVVLTFQMDGETLQVIGAIDEFGSEGLTLTRAEAVARETSASLFTIDLEAGFPLDPTFFSVNGGGEVDASLLLAGCQGFIHREPVVTVNWTGTTDFVEAFFVSDHDPTLVVATPDGQVLCNDNANPHLLDPVIEIPNPVEGTYRIWVGSADAGQLIPGVLVLTTDPEVNLSTFSLGGLIRRPALPEILPEPEVEAAAAAALEALEEAAAAAPVLAAGAAEVTAEIQAEGLIPAFAIPELKHLGCSGLMSATPDYVFNWDGETASLRLYFESQQDSTLMVVGADGEIVVCSDDADSDANLNPLIELASPPAGGYGVFVGRLDPDQALTGTLTITEGTGQPAQLAPEAAQ